MTHNGKKTPLQMAYENCEQARNKQVDLFLKGKSRKIDVIEDKSGILVERFLIGKTNAILFSTPLWWNIYVPLTEDDDIGVTLAALDDLA